jgi:predicted small metal-binding protein
MLTVSCRDVAAECDFVGRANSEDELMMLLLGHIVKNHRSELAEIMKQNIREKIRYNIQRQ